MSPQWLLKPLFFEVPQRDPTPPAFVGRQWLYGEILEHLASELPTNRGVVVTGAPGTGKTGPFPDFPVRTGSGPVRDSLQALVAEAMS